MITGLTYEQFVNDVFIEHHISMGLDIEETNILIEESTFKQREKWLIKRGYDLDFDYQATISQ